MPRNHEFGREDPFPSYFVNRIQDFVAGSESNLRLSLKSTTVVEIVPDPTLGLATIPIEGRWRFNDAAIERAHPGGAKGTYIVWAVAEDEDVDNVPDPFTDHTDYTFEMRITSGAEPEGAGIDIVEKIGEIDWSGTEIEALRQTFNSVPGAKIADGALSGSGDITWSRDASGAWVPNVKANAIGANELADNSVDSNALIDLAVITAKIAALAITEGKLAENSVATAKIIALAVTTAKIAAQAVTAEKLGNEAVEEAKIKALAVTAAKLAAESVTEAKIGNLAVTEAKLAAESVSTGKIKNLAVTAAKIAAEAIETAKIANLAVTAAKLAAECVETAKIKDGAVTDPKLASPNNSVYRTIFEASTVFSLDETSGTYLLGYGSNDSFKSGDSLVGGGGIRFLGPAVFYLDDADYGVSGKTTKLRMRLQVFVNNTKAALKFTGGLYPLASNEGAEDILKLTAGAVVAGSSAEVNEPAAKATVSGVGSDFDIPADGIYFLGVNFGAALTNNSAVYVSAQLQMRHV